VEVEHFGYLLNKYRKYGIHKTPPSLAPGYPARSKVPIGWLDGNTIAIAPDMLPKHPRNEARNAVARVATSTFVTFRISNYNYVQAIFAYGPSGGPSEVASKKTELCVG
jgi:hypothetical protein